MTTERRPDQIMAEYLLKGGKMLAKTCPVCHSPLFEIKGETLCVVCRETGEDPDDAGTQVISGKKAESPRISGGIPIDLGEEFSLTLRALLVQVREERDAMRIVHLMEAVKTGAEAYSLLNQGYFRRDSS